jgi:hypothetical protein
MSILQDPIRSIRQAEEYIRNADSGQFPEANEMAAGNLCRQLLEQVLFILCFYSRMPPQAFIRPDRSLKTAGKLLEELDKIDKITTKSYWQLARERSPRVAKFACRPKTLRKWSRLLNEPSHFSLKYRKVSADKLLLFVTFIKSLFDESDWHLITVAINELFSNGRYTAQIGEFPQCTPGLMSRLVVSAYHLKKEANGSLSIIVPGRSVKIIPADRIPRGPWPKLPVLIQGSSGIGIMFQLINKNGNPINLTNGQTILDTIAETIPQKRYLIGRLRKLGLSVKAIPTK